jgi:hypothetical protein
VEKSLSRAVSDLELNQRTLLRRSAAQDGAAAERAMSSEPLKLELDGRALSFATLDDFAFGLSGRTRMAADSIGRLMQLTPSELRREATNIRDVERRFVDLLAEALKDPGAVAALLRQVDGSLITEENQWRSIIAAIAREGRGLEAYTHLAIVRRPGARGRRRRAIHPQARGRRRVEYGAIAGSISTPAARRDRAGVRTP